MRAWEGKRGNNKCPMVEVGQMCESNSYTFVHTRSKHCHGLVTLQATEIGHRVQREGAQSVLHREADGREQLLHLPFTLLPV